MPQYNFEYANSNGSDAQAQSAIVASIRFSLSMQYECCNYKQGIFLAVAARKARPISFEPNQSFKAESMIRAQS